MLYDIQYDIASLIAVFTLLTIYVIRRTYKTKSNKLFYALLVCDIFGASFDILSCVCISYPTLLPMWYNYIGCLGYLFLYNMMGVLFYAYIDSRAKIPCMEKISKLIVLGVIVIEAVLIFTSPITHWIAYFDKDLVYRHGPLMPVLYIIAFLLLLGSAILFCVGRRRFNFYQIFALCLFVVAVFSGVMIQMLMPRILVGQFGCTLVLFFIYTSLENPAYYTYKQTKCLNRNSFLYTIKKYILQRKKYSLVVFSINDFDELRRNLSLKNQDRLSSKIAEFVATKFKSNGYCLKDDRFVVIVDSKKVDDNTGQIIKDHFKKPVVLVDTEVFVSVKRHFLGGLDERYNIDTIESVIDYILDSSEFERYVVDFDAVVAGVWRRRKISIILKNALKNNLFDIHFQPIKDVATGKFVSVEALIRLKDDSLGYISPEEFIPIAENDGIIYEIGELVFKNVCQFIKESGCINMGVEYIEINLSPMQCHQKEIVEIFDGIMREFDVKPEWINLEITETASFSDENTMMKNITRFHNMGISFSIDDFGSGFASINYLFKLPVEIVKIDKGILWKAMKDENAMIVLESTMRMLQKLNKKIVVEGVEDENMVALLESFDCDYMQGYYYSKPLPKDKYIEFLKQHNM